MRDDEKAPEQPVIQWRIEEWFPDLAKEAVAKLKLMHDELIKANRSISLVSPKTIPMADVIHFADSILASRIIMRANPKIDTLYDFGSGNGFPGLIFAIQFPGTKVVLVDSDVKKVEYLKGLISVMQISNASVMAQAVESIPEGTVKYAVSRGFNNVSKAILLARKCVQKGGFFFQLKSEEWGMEVSEIPTQLCSIWTPSLTGEYKLPIGAVRFAIVQTEKIA